MTSYNEIPLVESNECIQDYVEQVAGLSIELGGKMKYALESAINKARSDGYDQGFRDGSVYHPEAGSDEEEPPF